MHGYMGVWHHDGMKNTLTLNMMLSSWKYLSRVEVGEEEEEEEEGRSED